jgi:hypothetical protein
MIGFSVRLLANECTWKTLTLRRVCGIVMDWDGKPLPGVEIVVSKEKTDLEWHTVSANDGSYSISDIPAGRYVLNVRSHGYGEPRQPIKISRPSKSDQCDRSLRIEVEPGRGDCPGGKIILEKK